MSYLSRLIQAGSEKNTMKPHLTPVTGALSSVCVECLRPLRASISCPHHERNGSIRRVSAASMSKPCVLGPREKNEAAEPRSPMSKTRKPNLPYHQGQMSCKARSSPRRVCEFRDDISPDCIPYCGRSRPGRYSPRKVWLYYLLQGPAP